MKFVYFILFAALYAGLPGHTFSIFRRAANTCTCSKKLTCAPKFQLLPGHTACMTKSPNAQPVEVTAEDKKKIVDLHNKLRGEVKPVATNMQTMIWDDELAMLARKWADTCTVGHDSLKYIPDRFAVGQNFARGQNSYEEAILYWHSEAKDYTPIFGKPISTAGNGPVTGHYTQIVWAETNRIGCAMTICNNVKQYICNYGPAGNVIGYSSPYETGPKRCSKCKKCDKNGLCDCGGLQCFNGGTVDTQTCTCKCSNPLINSGPNCQANCANKEPSHCNTNPNFMAKDCHKFYVLSTCPHTCKYCPCGERKSC